MTARNPMKAHCNTCGGSRDHEVRDHVPFRESDREQGIEWGEDDFFLRCLGCSDVKILHQSWFSEYTDENGNVITTDTYYPSSAFRKTPDWTAKLDKDWHITRLLAEIYRAIQNDAQALAAMGLRSLIETVMIDKVKDQGSFQKNLALFQSKGFISRIQERVLQGALELGHATIHRGHTPTEEQLKLSMDIVENIIQALYVLDQHSAITFGEIPKRGT